MSKTHGRSSALVWLRLAAVMMLLFTPLRSFATFALGTCENFENGTTGWTISSGTRAGTSSQAYQSASNSLYVRGGTVTVTSSAVDLSGEQTARVSVWIRRGGAFSAPPETGDDLEVYYLNSSNTYVLLDTLDGGGTAGQVYNENYLLPTDALHAGFKLRFRLVTGDNNDYWHIDDACVVNGLVSYRFEETSWSAAAGQVKDSGDSGIDGQAYGNATTANSSPNPAINTNPGTCRYGVFDGSTKWVQVPDSPALDIPDELTVTAWIYPKATPADLQTILSKDTNYEFHLNSSRQIYWWWNGPTLTTTGTAVSLNAWHHIAISYKSGLQKIYIDGVERASSTQTGTLPQNSDPLFIGTDLDFASRDFNGNIDEVRIIPRYLTQAQIQTIMNETHPCVSAAKFTINHNGFGINCVAETITVNVVDATAGTPLTNYSSQVQLDTQTGAGTWAKTSGSGTFSDGAANDGVATYNWPLGESTATFTLYYPSGPPSMDIDVFQVSNTGIRDTDAEGLLTFSPSGFTVTAAALSNPPPASIATFAANQTAGTTFNLYLAAYGQTPTDTTCGVIEAYTGAKSLKFWSTYVNPTTGTRNVAINGVNTATVEGSAAAQNITFANGQAVVQAKYKDVGRMKIAMKDDTTTNASQLPAGIRGSTANFVSRPNDFTLTSITNSSSGANPGAANAAGGVFTSAGTAFNMTLTVRDAEGTATPNFGKETGGETESVKFAVGLVAPAGGAVPALSPTTLTAFTNGVANVTSFSWAEVGVIQLTADVGDGDYLTAGDVSTTSGNIGRFIPARFDVALNTPLIVPSCSSDLVNGFSYQGQTFNYKTTSPVSTPVITATAKSATGLVTQNYTSAVTPSFFKLASSTLAGTYSSAGSAATFQVNGTLPPPTATPAVAASAPGVATLSFPTANFGFRRTTAAVPFTAGLKLAINVTDSDGVAAVGTAPLTNPVTFGYGNGVAFDSTNFPYGEIRYGRIRLANALGSERVDLPMEMMSEYYVSTAAGFLQNTLDSCSTNVALALSNPTDNLLASETCVRDSGSPGASGIGCSAAAAAGIRYAEPPSAGDFNLRLAAPGVGNQGSVLVTATVPSWLKFDWNTSTSGDENPSGEATFGVFSGETRQIYTREIY